MKVRFLSPLPHPLAVGLPGLICVLTLFFNLAPHHPELGEVLVMLQGLGAQLLSSLYVPQHPLQLHRLHKHLHRPWTHFINTDTCDLCECNFSSWTAENISFHVRQIQFSQTESKLMDRIIQQAVLSGSSEPPANTNKGSFYTCPQIQSSSLKSAWRLKKLHWQHLSTWTQLTVFQPAWPPGQTDCKRELNDHVGISC